MKQIFKKPLGAVRTKQLLFSLVAFLLSAYVVNAQTYCTPSYALSDDYTSSFFTSGAIIDISYTALEQTGVNGYDNLTSEIISQSAGNSFDFTHVYEASLFNHGLRIWIDWNNDGTFSDSEQVFFSISADKEQTGTITIPSTTSEGNYRMRVRSRWFSSGSNPPASDIDPCDLISFGQALDFTLSVGPEPTCLPIANLTTANITFTSVDVFWTAGQTETSWNVSWGPQDYTPGDSDEIGTQTVSSPNISINGLTAETNYRIYVRADCGSGDVSAWKSIIIFTGYCVPKVIYTADYTSEFYTSQAVTNISYTGTQSGYINNSSQIITIPAGVSFDFFHSYIGGLNTIRIWVDWNKDLTFDDTEEVFLSSLYDAEQTGIITVPLGTPIGNYRMRIRSVYDTNVAIAPCLTHNYGTTIDYTLNVTETPTCMPVTNFNTTNETLTSVDVSWTAGDTEASWNISWGPQGYTPGDSDEIGTQTVSSPNASIVGLTPHTNYQIYVQADCGSGDSSFWRNVNYRSGHCVPNGLLTYSDYYISSAKTSGALVDIDYFATSVVAYVDSQSTIYATQNSSFTFTINQNLGTGYFYIWADWNNNMSFDDAGETVFTSTYVYNQSVTGTITIPANLPLGNYRIRIANSYSGIINSACGPSYYGNFVDFNLAVVDPPSCTPPTNLTFMPNSLTNVTLGWTSDGNLFDVEWGEAGFTLGSGTPINALTTNSTSVTIITNTNYQFYVRRDCGNSDTSFWSGPFNFITGYCMPSYNSGCDNGATITNFEINNAIINLSNTSGCGTNGYNNFTSFSATASEGYQLSFVVGVGSYSGSVKLWVDWNNNGLFEPNELIAESSTEIVAGNTFTGTFTVPAGTQIGDYRLRVRVVESDTSFTACSLQNYGEAEDYTLKIITPPTCMPVSLPITATNSSATSTLLQWVSDGTSFDIEYGVQGFTQGSGTTITEVSNPYILQGLTAGTQYQYYVRQNCGNGDESMWRGPVSFIPGNFDGKISSRLHTEPQVTSLACGSTFAIEVPAGKQIASLKVDYMITSVSPRWMSEQRSVLYSPTLNAGEPDVISGPSANDFPGVQDYSRSVNFANGATGTVEFELKAWRIAGNQGCTDNEIFVEPGTWILTPTFEDIPACPNPPTDLGYNVISESSVELFWTAGTSGATHQLKYGNIGFDVNTAGTSEDNLTANMLTLTGLDSSIQYEFYVRRDCGAGDFSTWVGPFKFNSGYCIPTSDITYHFTVFNTTNAIQNASYSGTSSGTGYVNNTNEVDLVIEQEHGQSFDFTSNYIGGASGLRIWVDWNKNFVFDDSEQVFYLGNNSGSKSGTITIPLGTITGDYRMRVRAEQGSSSIPSACGEIAMGEALDFTLKVNGAVSVANFDLYEFRYHPNPVNDILHFSSNSKIESVTISNILGQQISANLNSDNTILDMSNLPSGNYFVKVTIESVSKTIKVIKN